MKVKQLIITSAILAGSVIGFVILKESRPIIHKKEAKELSYLVKIDTLRANNESIVIPVSGEIKAAHEYFITAEVKGKVDNVSGKLIAGAKFGKDELLFTVDPREYMAELEKAHAGLNIAQYDLDLAEGKAKAGIFAWEIQNKGLSEQDKQERINSKEYSLSTGLVDKDKQEESLTSAVSHLTLKELDIERTEFRAPCNGVVLSENVELGQLVNVGDSPVKFVCTDYFYLESDIISNKLQYLQFNQDSEIDSDVIVYNTDSGLEKYGYKGKILSFIPQVSQSGRVARSLIKVFEPMQYDIPLFIGSFVEGTVEGKVLENVFKLKYSSLRNNSTVWLVDNNNRMKIVKVNVVFSDREYVYVDSGIKNGDRVVTSKVPTAVNGLKLEINE
ncbi:MAG TPA: hypothetical protein DCL21_04260 [Alphaproteobacteria bacterium]|nr:hypothetical protein [Alphaproteobacteria bacterium]